MILQTAPSGTKKKRRQRRRWQHTLVLAAIGVAFIAIVALVQPFYTINLWFSDQFLSNDPPSPNIVIAGIDDASLQAYGRWSEWPRSLHTRAIDNLAAAGAKVIGFDVIFADDSPDDPALAAAIQAAGNVVLVGVGTESVTSPGPGPAYENVILPAPPLLEATAGLGHANVVPDPDGTVRRVPLVIEDNAGDVYPAFTLATLSALFGIPLPAQYAPQNGHLHLLARDVPVDGTDSLRINFSTQTMNYTYLSYRDVIEGDFDPSVVKNKIVLVGMTATGDIDAWAVPNAAGKVPGLYVHAAAIDTILRQRFLTDVGLNVTILIMLFFVAVIALALPRLGTWHWKDIVRGTGVVVGLLVAYLVAGSLTADRGYVLNMLYPVATLAVMYIGNSLSMIVMEQSDKKFVKELFGRYVSPEISKEIIDMADTGELNLGGEEREVTVFFADIRNFTTISERMSPEAIVKMLNVYFSIAVDIITQYRGIVNKFNGDNIMAIWNAPQLQPEHVRLAAKAAWDIQQQIAKRQREDPDLPPVQFGIGINTGRALAGNIGSSGRAEYTVIGDAVNLASRICGSAPGGTVRIGPETYLQIRDLVEVEEHPSQTFKGKAEPITVYTITGWREAG